MKFVQMFAGALFRSIPSMARNGCQVNSESILRQAKLAVCSRFFSDYNFIHFFSTKKKLNFDVDETKVNIREVLNHNWINMNGARQPQEKTLMTSNTLHRLVTFLSTRYRKTNLQFIRSFFQTVRKNIQPCKTDFYIDTLIDWIQ